jgi:hypothetical protein
MRAEHRTAGSVRRGPGDCVFFSFRLSGFIFVSWCFQASVVYRSIKYDNLVYINIMVLGACQKISVGEATAIAVSC